MFHFFRNLIFLFHVKMLYLCGDIVGSNREHTWSKSRKQQSPWDFIYPKEIIIYESLTKYQPALPNGRCVFRWRGGGSLFLEVQPCVF